MQANINLGFGEDLKGDDPLQSESEPFAVTDGGHW